MCCEQCHEAGCKEQQGAQGEVAAGGQAGAQVVGWWWAGSHRTVGTERWWMRTFWLVGGVGGGGGGGGSPTGIKSGVAKVCSVDRSGWALARW